MELDPEERELNTLYAEREVLLNEVESLRLLVQAQGKIVEAARAKPESAYFFARRNGKSSLAAWLNDLEAALLALKEAEEKK